MVVGFTTTYGISVYHHQSCEFESCSWRGVLDTTLCDKVCPGMTSEYLPDKWFCHMNSDAQFKLVGFDFVYGV
jgi:hypothetical protein